MCVYDVITNESDGARERERRREYREVAVFANIKSERSPLTSISSSSELSDSISYLYKVSITSICDHRTYATRLSLLSYDSLSE